MKSLLFIVTKAPYESFLAQEFFDTIFFASSYGLKVSVLFTDAGIKQLQEHDTEQQAIKNIFKQITAFEHFDITNIYVTQSIKQASMIPVKYINSETELKKQFDYVIYDEVPCQS